MKILYISDLTHTRLKQKTVYKNTMNIKKPKDYYGFKMGEDRKLARWDKIVEYFWYLDTYPTVKVWNMGETTEGNPFLLVAISSPENLQNLEKIRKDSYTLAHPEDIPEDTIKEIIQNGKTIVSMTMSVHASEIGGTQCSSELAFTIATSNEPEIMNIRENTVFLLVPCSNPDGNIKVVDYYYKYLGTEYEGGPIPYLYHKYVGHDNNRDAFHITQIESKYLTKFLYEWYPQAHIDHHHQGTYAARFTIPPHMDPLYEEVDPLIWTEQQLYGGAMIMELEANGKTGIETQASYPADGGPYWDEAPIAHGICGMLTESASAKLATPAYVHHQQIEPSRRGRPETRPQMNYPHPWMGGWWKLRDIIEQQKIASIATLKTAAKFRQQILQNMYKKAQRQIEKGRKEPPYAFIFHPEQHDPLIAKSLMQTLALADVQFHNATEEFSYSGIKYPSGTHIVFTNQITRPYILKLLRETHYHDGPHTRTKENTPLSPYDFSTDNLAEFMNVKVIEVKKPLKGKFEKTTIKNSKGDIKNSKTGHLLDGRQNYSYAVVNNLLKSSVIVYRALEPVGDIPKGAFYIPYQKDNEEKLRKEAEKYHVIFYNIESTNFNTQKLQSQRIGVYQRYRGGNMDEGWLRWVLEQYNYEYKTLIDEEIKEGMLEKSYDVIIIPSDDRHMILGKEKDIEDYYKKLRPKSIPPNYPPEYLSGIGDEGVKKLKEFAEAGGTLITLGKACSLALEDLKLPIIDVLKDIKSEDFHCPGSTLKINICNDSPLTYGIAEDTLLLFRGYPAFQIKQTENNQDYRIIVSYPEERMKVSGWLIGEKYLSNKAALIEAKLGTGRVILYGFSPHLRSITTATFKLLFNALLG